MAWKYNATIKSLHTPFCREWKYDVTLWSSPKFLRSEVTNHPLYIYIFTAMELGSGGGYIVALYFHCNGTREWEWIYHGIIYSPHITKEWRVDIWRHYILNLMELENGGGYIVALYFHCNGTREWEWIYHGIIYSPHTTKEWRVDIWRHYILNLMERENGGGYIVALYIHSHGTIEWGWMHCGIIYSPPYNQRVAGGYILILHIHSHGTWMGVDKPWHYTSTAMELESLSCIKPWKWYKHFQSLFRPPAECGANSQFSKYVSGTLPTLEGVSVPNNDLNKSFTADEIKDTIKDIKIGESTFLDELSDELFKFTFDTLCSLVQYDSLHGRFCITMEWGFNHPNTQEKWSTLCKQLPGNYYIHLHRERFYKNLD